MTSRRRKGFEPPESPHFFKIMLSSDTLPGGKPGMPKKFLQKHGNDLSSLVFLKVPNGEIWPVQLEWNDGRVLLGKGWLKFVNYYSIVPGQLILFRYEPNSIFQVVIFDTSSSEIEYPTEPTIGQKSKAGYEFPPPKKEETDDIPVIISEDCWPSRITSKEVKWASGETSSGLAGEDTSNSHKHIICIIRKSERRASSVSHRSKGLSPALEMARKYKSVYPTFVIVMSPGSLRYCSAVRLCMT
ncbi:hypothetical protein BT93_A0509 [Corymbia citriodora subsp. variegata]|nr:hypothetical protein BT93_A0509 [Corymbia citriodora subsp. variegata]